MSNIVEQLQAKMKKDKVSVPALSKSTDIPQDRIYSWFRGKGNPKAEDVEKIKKYLEFGTNPNSDYQAEYLEIIRNCSEAARDAAFAAKESSLAVNKLIPANSVPSLEEKVDHIFQTLAAEKVGRVAVQTLLLREIAKKDGRKYEDVYNEFLDNELAEAAGVQPKASSRQGLENVGRKDKAAHTSS